MSALDPLATPAQLASHLGITIAAESDDETRATQLLAGVSTLVRRVARQDISRVADDTVSLRGTWQRILHLPEAPVVSVSAVSIDGAAVPATDWTLLPHGRLRRGSTGSLLGRYASGSWGGDHADVAVTYTHGWDPAPYWIVDLVLHVAGRRWLNPEGLIRKQMDDYAVTFADEAGQSGHLTEYEHKLLTDLNPTR